MKKTKKTMLTSAILSAALAAQGENMIGSPVKVNSAPVYGPPPAAGDINYDGKVNIADYVLLKSGIAEHEFEYQGDVNGDGVLDSRDAYQYRSFMFGQTDAINDITDNDDNVQTTYGPPIAVIPDVTETEQPLVTDVPDTGEEPEISKVTTTKKPGRTTKITTNIAPSIVTTEMPQLVYGPPSVFSTIASAQLPEITEMEKVTTVVYGPPSVFTTTYPQETIQLVYGPFPAYTTVNDVQQEEPNVVEVPVIQHKYGPPSVLFGDDEVE